VQGPRHIAQGGIAMEYPDLVLAPPVASTIAHEVAHQWWYSLVGDDEWREPWLDEAFAEYSAARLPARAFPNRLGDCRFRRRAPLPVVATMGQVDHARGRGYARSVYVAGACALRGLAKRLGSRRMNALLRGVVARHRYGVLTGEELLAAVRALDAGAARSFARAIEPR
jgi:aminopeptidase N